jgi:hypothetical protein
LPGAIRAALCKSGAVVEKAAMRRDETEKECPHGSLPGTAGPTLKNPRVGHPLLSEDGRADIKAVFGASAHLKFGIRESIGYGGVLPMATFTD